ncbi:hypothetical protein ACWEO1_13620 [Kitasatospora cineracea]
MLSDRTLTPHHFRVGTLDEDESRSLLTELSGRPDPALAEVARLCGHLPLALRVAGALMTDRTPAELATDLTDTRERETLRLLRSLTRAHLVEAADRRYRLHDLVKLYAAERPADDAEQGMVRLARFYAAVAATIEPNLRARGEWISAEGENVFATHHAVGFGLDPHVSAALDDGITWYLLQSAVFRAIAAGNVGAARGSAPHREDLTEMIRIESVDDLFTSSASLPRGPELSSLLVLLKELTANAAQPELTPDVLPEYFRLLSDGLCRFRAGAERMGGLLGPQEAELRELEEQLTDMAKGATGGR